MQDLTSRLCAFGKVVSTHKEYYNYNYYNYYAPLQPQEEIP